MPTGYTEDKDDVLIENLNTTLLLILGSLSALVSVLIFIHSATVAIYAQHLPMDSLSSLILAAVFFAVGFGSLRLFRKRRESRKKKETAIF